MNNLEVYSVSAIEAAYDCGVKAALGGFPSTWNQFHGAHKTLFDAWLTGHKSAEPIANSRWSCVNPTNY